MNPESNNPENEDPQIERTDAIEDLSNAIRGDDASQVKGGFDPQPDPPRILDPIQISAKIIKQ